MTTPRQYTDATDPNLNPPDHGVQQHEMQQTEEYATTGHRDPSAQHLDTSGQRLDAPGQQFDTSGQHLDPSGQRFDTSGQQFDTSAQRTDTSTQQFAPPAAGTDAPPASSTPGSGNESDRGDGLFAEHDLADLRNRWNDVQAGFVDDPRECVQRADGLVSSAVDQLTASFAQTRSRLEEQWSRGEEASTEDLRLALKRYRDFFDRLLAV